MMSDNILEIQGLKTHFFTKEGVVKAVDGIDLYVGKNEAIGIVGESGCGKTQTALSILRIIPIPGKIVEGKVFLHGKNLVQLSDKEMQQIRGKDISITFQDPMTFLNPVIKIKEQKLLNLLKR